MECATKQNLRSACAYAQSDQSLDQGHQIVKALLSAFYKGLHCLLRQNDLRRKKYKFYLEIITCGLSISTKDIPSLIYQTRRKGPLLHKRLTHTFEDLETGITSEGVFYNFCNKKFRFISIQFSFSRVYATTFI